MFRAIIFFVFFIFFIFRPIFAQQGASIFLMPLFEKLNQVAETPFGPQLNPNETRFQPFGPQLNPNETKFQSHSDSNETHVGTQLGSNFTSINSGFTTENQIGSNFTNITTKNVTYTDAEGFTVEFQKIVLALKFSIRSDFRTHSGSLLHFRTFAESPLRLMTLTKPPPPHTLKSGSQ